MTHLCDATTANEYPEPRSRVQRGSVIAEIRMMPIEQQLGTEADLVNLPFSVRRDALAIAGQILLEIAYREGEDVVRTGNAIGAEKAMIFDQDVVLFGDAEDAEIEMIFDLGARRLAIDVAADGRHRIARVRSDGIEQFEFSKPYAARTHVAWLFGE